jgi:hypothetical protein
LILIETNALQVFCASALVDKTVGITTAKVRSAPVALIERTIPRLELFAELYITSQLRYLGTACQ